MKKLSFICTCFLISILSFGQSDSIVLWDKKSGKEITLKEGEKIKVLIGGNKLYLGKLNKIFYDSSLSTTMLTIDNHTIPYSIVKSIINKTKLKDLKEKESLLNKNNIYGEGHIGIFSQIVLNYERKVFSYKSLSCYGRLGAGYGVNLYDGLFDAVGGVGGLGALTMLTGKKKHHFELNAGAFIGDENGNKFIFPLLNFGYRYQKPGIDRIFRVNVGIISLGISFGTTF